MLSIFRRHGIRCQHKSAPRGERRKLRNCSCALWADGIVGGKEIRKSLKTRNWQRAQKLVRNMEIADKEPDERITIERACKSFLEDATARGLRKSSLDRYNLDLSPFLRQPVKRQYPANGGTEHGIVSTKVHA